MISRNKRSVKAARPQSVGAAQTATTTKPPVTVDDLLRRTPLPAKYRHLTARLRKITAVDLIQTVLACVHQGFSDDGIGDALATVADYYESDDHRCTTCLAWSKRDEAITGAMVDTDGVFSLVTICARCQKLIATGRATPTMERNLMAYGYGGK